MANVKNLVAPEHIGDGLYLIDHGDNVAVAVNHHTNEVAYIDSFFIDRVIDYLTRVKGMKAGKTKFEVINEIRQNLKE